MAMDDGTEARRRKDPTWTYFKVFREVRQYYDGFPPVPLVDEDGRSLNDWEMWHLFAYALYLGPCDDEDELRGPCLKELKRYRSIHGDENPTPFSGDGEGYGPKKDEPTQPPS
jgi:hypothetical protein